MYSYSSTLSKLLRLGDNSDNLCPLCSSYLETYEHLFLEYHFALVLWNLSHWPIGTLSLTNLSILVSL
jgi:hypothetical protein